MSIAIDANGNPLTDAQGRSFTWDFENRLTQATNPGVGTTTFKYDPFGRRIQKSGPLGTTNYLYDGDGENVIEEVDNGGNVLARYTRRAARPAKHNRSCSESQRRRETERTQPGATRGGEVMARISKRHPHPEPHSSLGRLMEKHLEWLLINNYSEDTADHARWSIADFIRWAEQRGLQHPMEVTRPILESYQRYLYYYRKGNGQPLTFRTQHSRLTPVRRWFRWLVRNNHILHNPASDLDLPRVEKRLPKTLLSADEVEHVMVVPDIKSPVGLRDRAILETFYSSGVRRAELIHLKLYDLDRERATLLIRQGKGKKDRMIPIGERALAWVEKYLREARSQLAVEPHDATLFLTQYGEPFHPDALSYLARDYIAQANLGKSGSRHTFRHTMATLMREGGADIRYIQQMLGHAELSTTEIYTHAAIRNLQQIHAATHPGAKLERGKPAGTKDDNGQGDDEQKAALLAALEAESDEEE